MRISRLQSASTILVVLIFASPSRALQYSETLLSPFSMAFDAYGNSQVGSGIVAGTGNSEHALLWTGTAESVIDLHPAGYVRSYAAGTSGATQVGNGILTEGGGHALLWRGSAESVVDLHPNGFAFSTAIDASEVSQVGFGSFVGEVTTHALIWRNTAVSAVDLNPVGFNMTFAEGASNTHQVGYGFGPASEGREHALLWSDTATSAVDLNPPGFSFSHAIGVYGTSQVGYADTTLDYKRHAILWNGSAASAVDLHPNGFKYSIATDVYGEFQVGYANCSLPACNDRAFLWNGTAESAVDLNVFLEQLRPSFTSSHATGISETGMIVGDAYDENEMRTYAVLWSPIPEPSDGSLIACVCAIISIFRLARPSTPHYCRQLFQNFLVEIVPRLVVGSHVK